MKLKSLPKIERPREKLIAKGPENLKIKFKNRDKIKIWQKLKF
jgi:hypothetical protein